MYSALAARLTAFLSILVVAAVTAVAGPRPADAATATPYFNVPNVNCSNGGRFEVLLPTTVYPGSGYRYEPVQGIYVFKKVNGSWQYNQQSSVYYENTAVSSGVVSQAGWYPNGNYYNFGAVSSTFWLSGGEFRAAISLQWTWSGASAYVWAGTHYSIDPWTFYSQAGSSCRFS